jgi:hypothetical protein
MFTFYKLSSFKAIQESIWERETVRENNTTTV